MANPLLDQSFESRIKQVQDEVKRRKQAVNARNPNTYVAHLWVRWLNVSVLGKGE